MNASAAARISLNCRELEQASLVVPVGFCLGAREFPRCVCVCRETQPAPGFPGLAALRERTEAVGFDQILSTPFRFRRENGELLLLHFLNRFAFCSPGCAFPVPAKNNFPHNFRFINMGWLKGVQHSAKNSRVYSGQAWLRLAAVTCLYF